MSKSEMQNSTRKSGGKGFQFNNRILELLYRKDKIDVILPLDKFFIKMPAPGIESHQLPMSLVVSTPVLTSWLKT